MGAIQSHLLRGWFFTLKAEDKSITNYRFAHEISGQRLSGILLTIA